MTDTGVVQEPWADASRQIEASFGLHFPPSRWHELAHGLGVAAARLGLPGAAACAERLAARRLSPAELQVVVGCLAIGESYFFRDPGLFEQLRTRVLPELVAARRAGTRQLRLWSAGCAAGEEAHSLAILLALQLPDWRGWDIEILATDINREAIRRARRGIYNAWAFRAALPAGAHHFLRPLPHGRMQVDAAIRALVRFETANLVHPGQAWPGAGSMDLVLCRNVLMYFAPPRALGTLQALGACLRPDGWLVTNAVETPARGVPGLAPVALEGVVALRPAPAAAASRPAPPGASPLTARTAGVLAPAVAALSAPPAAPLPAAGPPVPAPDSAHDAAAIAAQARALADGGQLDAARSLCLRAQDLDKLDARWPYLLAIILLEAGLLDEAATALQRTLFLQPRHALAHYTLAGIAVRQGRADAARRQFALAEASVAGAASPEAVLEGSGGMTVAALRALVAQGREALG